MPRVVSTKWISEVKSKFAEGKVIDETVCFNPAIQWLIIYLTHANIPFKIYNLGAGVKRITTETDTCPCCKRKL